MLYRGDGRLKAWAQADIDSVETLVDRIAVNRAFQAYAVVVILSAWFLIFQYA